MKRWRKSRPAYEVPRRILFHDGEITGTTNDSRRWKIKYVTEERLVAKVLFQYFPKIRKLE